MHENGQTGRLRELDETGSSSTFWLEQQQQQDGGRKKKKKKKSRLDWTCPFSLFAREKRNKEHETGLEKEKNVSLRWRMPSLLLSVYSRAGYGPKDQDWTNGLDVATGWGSRRKKKRERIRVRRRHRSKRRRTGRGRWLVALTGGRLRRLYRSVSDSASSRVSLCVCVSFRFFFFVFIPLSFSLVDSSYIRVFFLFPSPGTSLPFISLVSDVRVAREGAARRSKSLRGGV